ncbi:ABC transporter substrate-binding protein [Microtetraspora malaysiensis]|uniref:ABC transporter substrate-binding protein n=1 Tax=Microtetraspora malaysiensis TaxID=161358 RepID=UPI000A0159BB|nr:ABC transporter substrate-binding protein [Microtetraspora malaysiensis]
MVNTTRPVLSAAPKSGGKAVATPHILPRQRGARLIAATAALAVTGSLAVACSSATAPSGVDAGGRVVIAYNNDVNSLDPISADFSQTNSVVQSLYSTLVTYTTENKLVGSLATKFTMGDDAQTINITLRDDVTFHDGRKLTAADVKSTLDRVAKIGTGVANFTRDYKGTDVVSDTELTIKLDKPNSLFLGGLAKVYILNSALVEKNAGSDQGQSWLSSHDAGSGPFQLAAAGQGGGFTVTRFPQYWDFDDKRPSEIVYRLIKEAATQRDEVLAGNVDVAPTIAYPDVATLEKNGDVQVIKQLMSLQAVVYFNTSTGATADPAVRRAVQLAFDYNGALSAIRTGMGEVANGPLPSTMPCRPDLPTAERDVEKAKELLQSAGKKGLQLTLSYQPTEPNARQEATLLQSNLADIGVNLKLEPIAFPDYLTRLRDPAKIPQMMLLTEFAQFPDPGAMLVPYYDSRSVGSNRSGLNNPKLDALLDEARSNADADQRCEIYRKAQTVLAEDASALTMYTLVRPMAHTSRVTGVHQTAMGFGPWVPDFRIK